MDHNQDNIYEVEVVNINTNDGSTTYLCGANQHHCSETMLQHSIPNRSCDATDDTDGDGILDI